jgi:hypothetical protein
MANINNPHGLMPLGILIGGGPAMIEEYSKVVGYGTALFRWDAVNRVADGSIEASATPGTTLYSGVVLDRGAASTATTHHVIVSPGAIFEAQCGVAGLVAADMGLNGNLLLSAGSATTGASGHIVNTTGVDVTATLDVHLLGLCNIEGNAFGAYARLEILFNKHRMSPASVGV